jgi:hypothetical protein
VLFAAVNIGLLPSYLHSSDPTFSGIPAAMFSLVESSISVTTATTPLLKSFVLKFKIYSGTTPSVTKPLFTLTVTRRRSVDEDNQRRAMEPHFTDTVNSEGEGSFQRRDSHGLKKADSH